jgi:hypothetical protein
MVALSFLRSWRNGFEICKAIAAASGINVRPMIP